MTKLTTNLIFAAVLTAVPSSNTSSDIPSETSLLNTFTSCHNTTNDCIVQPLPPTNTEIELSETLKEFAITCFNGQKCNGIQKPDTPQEITLNYAEALNI